MTDTVTVYPEELRIAGEGWNLRADSVEVLGAGAWRALIGVRRGLKLLVTGTGLGQEVEVEAWAGEPGDSDGVAVIQAADGSPRVARVSLCGCGERGCGNAGVQFGRLVAGSELPALAGMLREFPWSEAVPTGSNVLRGDGLAALCVPDNEPPAGGRRYLGVARGRRSRPGSRGVGNR
jgi:hypothetical protein